MTKNYVTSKTLWMNLVALAAIIAQGQFGFVIDPSMQAALIVVINMLLRMVTHEELVWKSGGGDS